MTGRKKYINSKCRIFGDKYLVRNTCISIILMFIVYLNEMLSTQSTVRERVTYTQ